ncbi:MAG: tripartite tricarboxylate transporter substrate binding protein [Paracoccus sp. BP8]|nr:MAG: tripartite tricarboxylate transporter substrate binding protein [Paracoccus sp. BP8]
MSGSEMNRREFMASGLVCAGGLAIGAPALAASYPSKPIRLVVAFAPGGATDTVARLVSPYLSEALGTPVIVENKPGANGAIANSAVKNAAPDGHTLLLSNSSFIVATPHGATDADVNPVTDLKHIVMFATGRLILLTSPALKDMSLEDIVAQSKADPRAFANAAPGIGSINELAFEMFQRAVGSQIITAQYAGTGPIMTDLLADRVNMTVAAEASAEPYLKEDSLGALCTFGAERSAFLPDVPSSRELGIEGLDDLMFWNGLHAPAGIPAEIVVQLEEAFARILENENLQQRLADMRLKTVLLQGEDFERRVQQDWDMFGKIYRQTHG